MKNNIEDPKLVRQVKILEIGVYPPPFCGWGTRLYFVRQALDEAGHQCVPLNLGENRRIPSDEYECVRSGWERVGVCAHVPKDDLRALQILGIPCCLDFRVPLVRGRVPTLEIISVE